MVLHEDDETVRRALRNMRETLCSRWPDAVKFDELARGFGVNREDLGVLMSILTNVGMMYNAPGMLEMMRSVPIPGIRPPDKSNRLARYMRRQWWWRDLYRCTPQEGEFLHHLQHQLDEDSYEMTVLTVASVFPCVHGLKRWCWRQGWEFTIKGHRVTFKLSSSSAHHETYDPVSFCPDEKATTCDGGTGSLSE